MLQLTSFGAVRSIVCGIMVGSIAMASAPFLPAQLSHPSGRPAVRLPAEAAGIDAIVRALMGSLDRVDILALGEAHDRKVDSDLRIALVRHPDFATKVRSVVVECASTTEQPTLDRYMNGDSVPRKELQRGGKATSEGTNGFCDSPLYSDFLVAVREVNARLPVDRRIRVLGGDPGPGDNRSREVAAVSLIRQRVLTTHGRVLVVYGAAHFYLTMDDAYLVNHGRGPRAQGTDAPGVGVTPTRAIPGFHR